MVKTSLIRKYNVWEAIQIKNKNYKDILDSTENNVGVTIDRLP